MHEVYNAPVQTDHYDDSSMTRIDTGTFEFLAELAKGQDKAWFDAHRNRYETNLLQPMRELARGISVPLARCIPDLETTPAVNKTLTRINRDMRFVRPGQSPYKDHMLALFYRQGRKKVDPQLFVGVQPKEVWLGLYLGPGLISNVSPIARAVAEKPHAVVELGRSVGVGDALQLASCRRYGEIEQTLDGNDAGHYLAGPHLCVLARRSAAEATRASGDLTSDAAGVLIRLVPLWLAYAEGI